MHRDREMNKYINRKIDRGKERERERDTNIELGNLISLVILIRDSAKLVKNVNCVKFGLLTGMPSLGLT